MFGIGSSYCWVKGRYRFIKISLLFISIRGSSTVFSIVGTAILRHVINDITGFINGRGNSVTQWFSNYTRRLYGARHTQCANEALSRSITCAFQYILFIITGGFDTNIGSNLASGGLRNLFQHFFAHILETLHQPVLRRITSNTEWVGFKLSSNAAGGHCQRELNSSSNVASISSNSILRVFLTHTAGDIVPVLFRVLH